MKLITLSLCILFSITTTSWAAEAAFTDAQMKVIEKMLQDQREEILVELGYDRDHPAHASVTPEPAPAETPSALEPKSGNLPLVTYQALRQEVFDGRQAVLMGRSISSGASGFAIEGSTAESRASIRLSIEYPDSATLESGVGRFSGTDITFSAPLNKNDDLTNISTLDGLASSFQVSVAHSNFRVKTKENFPKNAWNWVYGAEATLGYKNFNFYDRTSITKQDQTETPWSTGLFGGFISADNRSLVSMGFEYQKSYQSSTSKTVCPSSTTTAWVDCITGNIGSPIKKIKHLAYLDYRRLFRHVGVSFRVTRDFENDETGLDLPIYLVRAKRPDPDTLGVFNGGIRLGWTSTDDFTVGVFVGSAFSILKK